MRNSRILCVSNRGNCRGAALLHLLRKKTDAEVLSVGWQSAPSALLMLCDWADWIIVLHGNFVRHVPRRFRNKIRVIDVEPDDFFHLDCCLRNQLSGQLEKTGLLEELKRTQND